MLLSLHRALAVNNGAVLMIPSDVFETMVFSLRRAYPLEGCGFLLGTYEGSSGLFDSLDNPDISATVVKWEPVENAAASARNFSVSPKEILRVDRQASEEGLEIVGVAHSHTHTEAFPSPTDVEISPDPSWFLVVVSLKGALPSVRTFRIISGKIYERAVVVK